MAIWYFGLLIALLRSLGSMHSRSILGFKIATTSMIQGVHSSTSVMIPCLVSSANLYFSGSFMATGTHCGTCCTNRILISTSM